MKLLGISCGRPMGNSELLLKHALKAAEETGKAEVSLIRLHDYRVLPCVGCELCTNLRLEGKPLRCKYSPDEDDFYQLMEHLKACDGVILAAPAYHLMPPGVLTVLLNRVHCVGFFNGSDINVKRSRVCATIGVGGTDWTNLLLPCMNFTGTEMCGSQMNLVDQMLVQDSPSVGSAAIYPGALERASLLGRRVAEALGTPNDQVRYQGDLPETCPICHSNLLEVHGAKVRCPICDVMGSLSIDDAGIHVHWEQGRAGSRWSDYGAEAHHVRRHNSRERFAAKKDEVAAIKAEWSSYLQPIKPVRP